jgi:uncharacterized C2H2 Zn-finger protein
MSNKIDNSDKGHTYLCPECELPFRRKEDVKRHIKSWHEEKYNELYNIVISQEKQESKLVSQTTKDKSSSGKAIITLVFVIIICICAYVGFTGNTTIFTSPAVET